MSKPLILVSNDDGITSNGIKKLVELMSQIGEVVVVAPNSPQSGMGHAITIGNTLRLTPNHIFKNIEAYECSGTPADCIKLAKNNLFEDREIDLVASGINHGSNTSISVLYSGTMSAAFEGALEGMHAIGFSLCDHNHEATLTHLDEHIIEIAENTLKNPLLRGVALNVNIPKAQNEKIKGIKYCRQSNSRWNDVFEKRTDPNGRDYFWLTGQFESNEKNGTDYDDWAIANNYISITPCSFDMTDYAMLKKLNGN